MTVSAFIWQVERDVPFYFSTKNRNGFFRFFQLNFCMRRFLMRGNTPAFFTSGMQNSLNTLSLATARAVTTSNDARKSLFCPKVSARSWKHCTSVNPSVSTNVFKKVMRLFNESTIVTFKPGKTIFSGILGNPAPAPTSQSDWSVNS